MLAIYLLGYRDQCLLRRWVTWQGTSIQSTVFWRGGASALLPSQIDGAGMPEQWSSYQSISFPYRHISMESRLFTFHTIKIAEMLQFLANWPGSLVGVYLGTGAHFSKRFVEPWKVAQKTLRWTVLFFFDAHTVLFWFGPFEWLPLSAAHTRIIWGETYW